MTLRPEVYKLALEEIEKNNESLCCVKIAIACHKLGIINDPNSEHVVAFRNVFRPAVWDEKLEKQGIFWPVSDRASRVNALKRMIEIAEHGRLETSDKT